MGAFDGYSTVKELGLQIINVSRLLHQRKNKMGLLNVSVNVPHCCLFRRHALVDSLGRPRRFCFPEIHSFLCRNP